MASVFFDEINACSIVQQKPNATVSLTPPTLSPHANEKPNMQHAPKKTFASVLSQTEDLFLQNLPDPTVRGEMTYIRIEDDLYQKLIAACKTNLIGRLLLRKGSKPLKVEALKASLQTLWQPTAAWQLVPLARGYYDIHFGTEEDMRRVWSNGTCSLDSGIFRLFQWKPDFDPYSPKIQSHSQVWIQIYGLSLEYWHPKILMSIARGVGIPLKLDRATRAKTYGYYARVLVEVDLSAPLPSSLTVERSDYGFLVDIVYENIPSKCASCGAVGHQAANCRSNKVQLDGSQKERGRSRSRNPKQISRPIVKPNNDAIAENHDHMAFTDNPIQDNLHENNVVNNEQIEDAAVDNIIVHKILRPLTI